jgi:prepilin-type N-terminal cleavage/methylation domain-containing protein
MRGSRRGGGFTLVELLVVIGIIAVLVSILLPVVSSIRKSAQTAATQSRMTQIASAIHAYYMDFNAYPGAVPNSAWTPSVDPAAYPADLTSTEDLIMALLGGWKIGTGTPAPLVFDPAQLGQGTILFNPLRLNERKNAYMAFRQEELSPTGATPTKLSNEPAFSYVKDSTIPELIDAYPDYRPLLYLRARPGAANGNVNKIVVEKYTSANADAHYNLGSVQGYLRTTTPKDTLTTNTGDTTNWPKTKDYFTNTMTGTAASGTGGVTAKNAGTYMLISAGPDRLFGTSDDIVVGGGGGQ